jgi:hypothetical protein
MPHLLSVYTDVDVHKDICQNLLCSDLKLDILVVSQLHVSVVEKVILLII